MTTVYARLHTAPTHDYSDDATGDACAILDAARGSILDQLAQCAEYDEQTPAMIYERARIVTHAIVRLAGWDGPADWRE